MILRDYQQEAYEGAFRVWNDRQSALIVLATALGKTVVFSHIAKHFLENTHKDIMVFAHREELVYQAKAKLEFITGEEVGIEMGDVRVDHACIFGTPRIIVSTVQTLVSGKRLSKFDPSKYALLVLDESHHALARTNKKVIEHFKQNQDLKFLGVTATPDRGDGMALGSIFDAVAINYGAHEGVSDGWLVKPKQLYVDVEGIDLRNVRTTAGDLNQGDVAEIMEEDRNARAVVDAINKHAGNRKTLVFASSVLQADKMCNLSNMYLPGSSKFICGSTPKEERRETHRLFEERKITRLFNCGVLTEGYDDPDIEVIAVARLTKSRALYTQMIGRGLRPIKEIAGLLGRLNKEWRVEAIAKSRKPNCEIMDFVGNSGRHKLVSLVDVLGGKYPQDVREAVAKKARKSGKTIDVEEALREAMALRERKEAIARANERLRHQKLESTTRYTLTEVDPFATFGIQRMVNTIAQVGITEAQRIFLEKQGIPCDGLSKRDASRLIGECIVRREEGLPSFKQQNLLKRFGFTDTPPNWKAELDARLGRRR